MNPGSSGRCIGPQIWAKAAKEVRLRKEPGLDRPEEGLGFQRDSKLAILDLWVTKRESRTWRNPNFSFENNLEIPNRSALELSLPDSRQLAAEFAGGVPSRRIWFSRSAARLASALIQKFRSPLTTQRKPSTGRLPRFVLLQLAVERCLTDAKQPRSGQLVPRCFL